MSSDTPAPQSPPPEAAAPPTTITAQPKTAPAGLPPVQPPTARQMLRLFVVPGLIVMVLVGLFLLGPTLSSWFRPSKTAEQFLRDLDDTNEDVRYRAASDLAQVLPRKDRRAEELARDVDLCLGLAKRLGATLENIAGPEQGYLNSRDDLKYEERVREEKKLDRDRNLITFLAASLGHVTVPVGVPLLGGMATKTEGMEANALAERRRRALFALATLGERLERYDALDDDDKDDLEEKLAAAAKKGGQDLPLPADEKSARDVLAARWEKAKKGDAAACARLALDGLRARRAGKPTTMGVTAVLAKTAKDEDLYVRQLTAFAANFWKGTPQEEKVLEDLLVDLANDDGRGADRFRAQQDLNPQTKNGRPFTKPAGYVVRADATLALTRRGSARVPMATLREMLDLDKLRDIYLIEQEEKPERKRRFLFWTWTEEAVPAERPNEPLVILTTTETLKALAKWRERQPKADVSGLLPLIEDLEKSDNADLAAQATRTKEALTR
jgi:hypothetical protein